MLNWPPSNIFRLGSKPKSLQTHRKLFENTQNNFPNVTISENRFVGENSFFKSRPHMAAQADPPEAKCSYIDPLSFILSSKTGLSRPKNDLLTQVFDLDPRFSWKSTFSFGGFFDLFLEEYSLLRRVRHNSKIEAKNDLPCWLQSVTCHMAPNIT